METYTLGVVLESSDQKIVSRLIRDLITLKSVTARQRMILQIACVESGLDNYLKELKIRRTPDLGQADYWRVYYSDSPPNRPDVEGEFELIRVDPPPMEKRNLRIDDNFTEPVVYRDIKRVFETVPWDKAPSRGPADPSVGF